MPPPLTLLALAWFATANAAEAPVDACAAWIPPTLTAQIARVFAGYRLPLSSDAGDARLQDIASQGDWPCPFVVIGDFDGDGRLDRALLLPARDGSSVRLIAAMNSADKSNGWQFSLNESWPLPLADSQLHPADAGFYQNPEAVTQPAAQLDQLAGLQIENIGFRVGPMQGARSVYALVSGQWQKLTLPPATD